MMATRIEHDALGEYPVPATALYGIHTCRAVDNTPMAGRPVHAGLIRAYGTVKLACVQVIHELGRWDTHTYEAIVEACNEMREGLLDTHIRVDALQGGAGTSTNMNVNEVLANRALQILGHLPGRHDILHPVLDLNCYQSTNDTYPTALRVAAISGIRALERAVIALQESFEEREKAFADVVKVGRTEMQDAVLTTMGRSMSAYAEAFSRDRWRLYKCEERLRVVNLGGTAIGTGIGAPREYIFRVTDVLRALTGFGLARAENLIEATQNTDSFVEVSGILKACASNLLKCAGDIRLMSSGPDAGLGELTLPALQTGSSIMPGKVNPVIPEAVTQAAIQVIANDLALTQAASLGNLELNAFMPLIADSLLDSLSLLTVACDRFARLCVQGLQVNADRCARHTGGSIATATALVAPLGYQQAEAVLAESRATGKSIADVLEQSGLMSREDFASLITPESVTRLGSPPPPVRTGMRNEECGMQNAYNAADGVEPVPPGMTSSSSPSPGGTGSTPSASCQPGGTGSTPSAEHKPVLQVRHRPAHLANIERHNQPVILFVTVCTHDREPLLANPEFQNRLVRAWQLADRWTVGRYLIMPDHVHLFCTPARTDAGSINQWTGYWKGLIARAIGGYGPLADSGTRKAERLQDADGVSPVPPVTTSTSPPSPGGTGLTPSASCQPGGTGSTPSASCQPGGTGSTPSAENKHSEHKPPLRFWQRDCWDTQLRDARHYEEKWAYVVLNPVRKQLVSTPAEWPYQGELNVLRW